MHGTRGGARDERRHATTHSTRNAWSTSRKEPSQREEATAAMLTGSAREGPREGREGEFASRYVDEQQGPERACPLRCEARLWQVVPLATRGCGAQTTGPRDLDHLGLGKWDHSSPQTRTAYQKGSVFSRWTHFQFVAESLLYLRTLLSDRSMVTSKISDCLPVEDDFAISKIF